MFTKTNMSHKNYLTVVFAIVLVALTVLNACLPKSPTESGGAVNITLYGYSIMKESLEKDIYPAFSAKWKKEHGVDVHFTSSFAGSETVTNQILSGVKAQVAILSIERDVQRLKEGGAVTADWHLLPQKGIVNKTPFVIIVRKGNPQGIHDFVDLGKPGIKVVHPDPVTSGGGNWSILALYGSELVKSEKQTGEADKVRALQTLQAIWRNVFTTPASAREARTTFELGNGDALVTYEVDALLMKAANAQVEIVIPEATILGEHLAVPIDRNITPADRPVVDGFLQYLWSDEAQRAFVKNHFRSSVNKAFDRENKELATIKYPFTVDYFGGWDRAYREVVQGVFEAEVRKRK